MRNLEISTDFINKSIPFSPPRITEDASIGIRLAMIPGGVFRGAPAFRPDKWIRMVEKSYPTSSNPSEATQYAILEATQYWLPANRLLADYLIKSYFTIFHPFRPVFFRKNIEEAVASLYEGRAHPVKGSLLTCVFVLLALATFAEERLGNNSNQLREWPGHSELFAAALFTNPESGLCLTTIQAHILIHQYLSIEVS
jgi:hypothetical protein